MLGKYKRLLHCFMENLSDLTLYVTFFVSLYFEVFMLLNFLDKRTHLKIEECKTPSRFPSVTILVPAFNEESTITKTIFSLLKLDYPKDKLKIIVINDGSVDGTAEKLKRFKGNRRVSIFYKKNGGKYTALNFGLLNVKTELVGCLDADSFVTIDALKKMVTYFENEKIMAVTPAIKIHQPKGFIRHVQSNEYNLGIFFKKCFSMIDAITVTPGPFSIFRKSVFDTIGNFKKAYNTEDLEMAMRMQKNRYKITNAHTAVVYTVGPNTLRKLFIQRVRWIHGFLANTIDYKEIIFNKKYGHLGMFSLPITLFSILLFFASSGFILLNIFSKINSKIVELQSIGFKWQWDTLNLDLMYIDPNSKIFLATILLISTVVLITLGQMISEKKLSFRAHTLYFPFVYGFLTFFWLSKGVYNTIMSKETKWR